MAVSKGYCDIQNLVNLRKTFWNGWFGIDIFSNILQKYLKVSAILLSFFMFFSFPIKLMRSLCRSLLENKGFIQIHWQIEDKCEISYLIRIFIQLDFHFIQSLVFLPFKKLTPSREHTVLKKAPLTKTAVEQFKNKLKLILIFCLEKRIIKQ